MFFTLSKILTFVIQPSSLAALMLGSGLWLMRYERPSPLARGLAGLGFGYFVLCGLLPVGNAILLPLEERFPPRPDWAGADKVSGVIILGGFEDGWVTAGRGGLAVNESAERLTDGVRLILRHPEAKAVFSGGVGSLWPGSVEVTGPVRNFLESVGIAPERIVVEGLSRNTDENARISAAILKPGPGDKWLLVTSAYHMPRAMGLFRKAGFDVLAYPVDYRTRGAGDIWRPFDRIPAGLQRMDLAVNEWIGLVAYRLTGRIDDLFPGP